MSTVVIKRVGTAVILIPVFIGIVKGAPAWLFVLVVIAVAAVAAGELGRMFERAGVPVYGRLGVAAASVVTASFATPFMTPAALVPAVVLTVAIAAVLSAPVWLGARPSVEPVALTLLGVVYVGWFLGHAISLHRTADGPDLILFLAGVTWIGESAAYAVGSTLGRHKLASAISPNKTMEGAVAQFAASVFAAVGLAAWLVPEWTAIRAAGAGALLGVTGQVGDLAESAMKRSVDVKDTGSLIPGHGGVLDRLDGLLFNAPALYYYVALGVRT
ncbi:MAG: phosphatidate cytidylyltransferase [Candidatus Rokuibacteriota bacterium]